MSAPSPAWRRMISNSSSVRRPGLLRISRGVCSLPTSCSAAAVRILATSASDAHRPRDPLRMPGHPLRMPVGVAVPRLEQLAQLGQGVDPHLVDAAPSSVSARASRRSVRARRSQPHSIRSAKTRSREPGVRFHSALPTVRRHDREQHPERDGDREHRGLARRDDRPHGERGQDHDERGREDGQWQPALQARRFSNRRFIAMRIGRSGANREFPGRTWPNGAAEPVAPRLRSASFPMGRGRRTWQGRVSGRPRVLLGGASDERLVALARAGDEQAFAAIVERYRAPLLRYCHGFLPPAAAEDALQQTFINAYAALSRDTARAPVSLRPWLYRVAHNAALNVARDPQAGLDQLPEGLDGVERPDEVVPAARAAAARGRRGAARCRRSSAR